MRARQIAYGRWEPWADAAPVREHVRELRRLGASYQAIASAAGVSPVTVHNLLNGCRARQRPQPQLIGSVQARRLLAVTAPAVWRERRNACGTCHRLRALVALGHPPATLASELGISQQRMQRLLCGQTGTVNIALHTSVCRLYSRMWNHLPAEHGRREHAAANAARRRAQAANWPPPMALDDDRIDDPAYRPRAGWRQALGSAATTRHGI